MSPAVFSARASGRMQATACVLLLVQQSGQRKTQDPNAGLTCRATVHCLQVTPPWAWLLVQGKQLPAATCWARVQTPTASRVSRQLPYIGQQPQVHRLVLQGLCLSALDLGHQHHSAGFVTDDYSQCSTPGMVYMQLSAAAMVVHESGKCSPSDGTNS